LKLIANITILYGLKVYSGHPYDYRGQLTGWTQNEGNLRAATYSSNVESNPPVSGKLY
jgi:hypothetical protein